MPACGSPTVARPSALATPSPFVPMVTVYVPPETPTVAPTPMAQWQSIGSGVDYLQRREKVGDTDDWVTVVRIDMILASLAVHYAPDTPRTVHRWFDTTDPDAVINAGFFTPANKTAGLVIADGKSYGQTYKGFGGMFSLRQGRPVLQWLAQQPYVFDPKVTQAVQSFPMLLLKGRIVDGLPDDGTRNRRSFVGIDRSGKVILGVCHSPLWTMTDLAQYLATNQLLNLDNALNLDGGSSSGLWLRGVPDVLLADSLEVVPMVIAINQRQVP